MNELFLKIINMSISASWLVLAVLILRLVLKKVPKWTNVLLWGIVAVRLICPFSVESPVSLIPDSVGNGELVSEWMDDYIGEVNIFHDNSVHYDAAIAAGREPISDGSGGYYVVTKYDQLGEPSTIENTVMPVLSIIWTTGMALLVLYTTISYWHLRRKVDTAVLYKDNIFQSENVNSPFVLGIIKPRIYLPFKLDGQDLEHVVAHEQAHIRRKDHWWKPLGFLLLTIHWFNPLMWLAYVLLCRDIELACDEKVIKDLGSEQRADYTQALVSCSINRRMIAACPLAFGEVGVKDRVKSVMNYKKPTFRIIVLAVISCVVVAICFLTDPPDDKLHAPEPFCHSYRVEEILFDDIRYSFTYSTKTAPRYQFTSDYAMFVSGDVLDDSDTMEWVQQYGKFEEVKITTQNFDNYFDMFGFQISNATWSKFRHGIDKAWRINVESSENNVFYYLLLTESEEVYLTYGYDIDNSNDVAEEGSHIRWLFKLARTDIVSCNAISEGLNTFIELQYYPERIDHDTDNWPAAQVNNSGTLIFNIDYDTNALIISEDYYHRNGDNVEIEKTAYELGRNENGVFALDVSCRGGVEDSVNYFIKIKGKTDVYVMKVVFRTDE